ncbi:MAG: Rid family detoxifying hydrolase [Bacteroidetes bacterium]|jgi:2-iminobutanoate/2-iminopropanoate deaminase|nr:Rid family detoxifying hydrolase [Bacteroidota bacterium]
MKKVIYTPDAPAPIGPYSQAIETGNTLYVSGQIAIDPTTGELDNLTIEAETKRVLQNLTAILKQANYQFEDVVKCSIFLSSMEYFGIVNELYATLFNEKTAPARETVAVVGLPKGVRVEISLIAQK